MHNVSRDHGVTNYLAGPIDSAGGPTLDWTSFVKVGSRPNLHIMPSGPIPPSPPELLGSERFSTLLKELKQSYDWVLVDSPPAASLADATLLASMVDMVILIVRQAQTDRDLVIKTVQRLRAINPVLVGAVLNYVDLERTYSKDYFHAGAYYYVEDDDTKKKAKRKVESTRNVG
jgi:capsular exopolysaccharide synthesis family protein